jgi:light-harvesting complex I chlorophyll a/b binding protein 1
VSIYSSWFHIARASLAVNAAEKSQALPFMPYPENLKGYVGDVGFDPLGISNYVPMDYLREAELKHARMCMLAWTGWVAVDLGMRVYPVPEGLEGVTSATAHNAAVAQGGMNQIFLFIAVLEMTSWLGISAMLQGSGRAPGDFSFGSKFLDGKSEAQVEEMKLKEIKNGRLAMMAFSGVVTQSILNGSSFPYNSL